MAVRAGAQVQAVVTLARRNTGQAVRNVPVFVQQFDPAIGDYRDIGDGVTGANGQARITFRMPDVPGTYRFRSRSDPTPEFRTDTSPAESIDVV